MRYGPDPDFTTAPSRRELAVAAAHLALLTHPLPAWPEALRNRLEEAADRERARRDAEARTPRRGG